MTAGGKPISELFRVWRWPRSTFDQRIEEIAASVTAYLNRRRGVTPSLTTATFPPDTRGRLREEVLISGDRRSRSRPLGAFRLEPDYLRFQALQKSEQPLIHHLKHLACCDLEPG